MLIIIVFLLGSDRPSGLLFFRARFISVHTHSSLLTVFVCLSYFILALPMREYLGKHSCMRSPLPCFFAKQHDRSGRSLACQTLTIIIKIISPRCSWPQPAKYNCVINGRSDWLAVTPLPLLGSSLWAPFAQYKSVQLLPGIESATFRIRGNRLAYLKKE